MLTVFVCLSVTLIAIMAGKTAHAASSDDESLRYIRIERQIDANRTNTTPHFAIVQTYRDKDVIGDIWVPSELLGQMKQPVKLDAEKQAFTVRIQNPAQTLEIPALGQFAPTMLDLGFRAGIYGFDGINIDFENVDNGDAARLTAFVKRLSTAGKSMGLTMSIDIMIPTKWSTCYQRNALSKIVDYVAVMTYDEHWRTSPKSGSTASLPWVKAGLQKTLTEVPANKLLLGIPFYTREWEETKKSDGKVSVKPRALGMASVDLRQEENNAAKTWQDNTGQHYFEYAKDGKRYRIWVEDEKSIQLRMALVKNHKLAGAAFWRKGFEKPEIWTHVQNAIEADTR